MPGPGVLQWQPGGEEGGPMCTPSHGEALCQQHPSQMDSGATGPCGTEDTAVALGSKSGEVSGVGHSSHAIGPGGPQASTLEEHPYKRLQCRQSFKKPSNLLSHRETHSRTSPCPDCGRTFNKPLSLLRHQRGHLGAVPFPCPDGGKAFTVASQMAEHQRVHTGERPFACPHCARAFAHAGTLKRHQQLHGGPLPTPTAPLHGPPYLPARCGAALTSLGWLGENHGKKHFWPFFFFFLFFFLKINR
uniref:C2H2-type domain-containing protein n=1 Tax=Aquila chrysaetos chrysaetos TaxID=223781 RepID=A0A663DT34_AQUCH